MVDRLHAIDRMSSCSGPSEARARRFWTIFILGFLATSVAMWSFVAYLAVSDVSTAIVPDYHQRALHWDQYEAVRRASQELGWVVQQVVTPGLDSSPNRRIEFFLRSQDGDPIVGCTGSVRMYHRAHGNDVFLRDLNEVEPGTYATELPIERNGHWVFEISLDRNQDHFEWSSEGVVEQSVWTKKSGTE